MKFIIFIIFFLFSCEKKQPEFIGLWVEDFETSYIKFTENQYQIKFLYTDNTFKTVPREIYGSILDYDEESKVITIKYDKVFDDKVLNDQIDLSQKKYFRYKIEEKILYFNVSNDPNTESELRGFFIKEPYE